MIHVDDVRKVVESYLERFPSERARQADLLESLDAQRSVTSRKTFTGHVTCSAVVVDADGRVLHIRHKALEMWLRPGGHLEPEDASLLGAALREVEEETGITGLSALDTVPIDIDTHTIPADDAKDEPDHSHHDMRWLFGVQGSPEVALQQEEVTQHDWLTLEHVEPQVLRDKLLPRLS